MKTMTLNKFVEITGMARSSLDRRLAEIDAHPVGSSSEAQLSYLWDLQDLVKAAMLVGERYERQL